MLGKLFFDTWQNLLASGLGAGLFFVAQLSAKWWRDRRERGKYPVAGEYITYYEDSVSGQQTPVKALMTVRQRGRRIEGTTRDVSGGRAHGGSEW